MYSGIGFVLLHHFWEKGWNECAGETRFEAMAFLPRIAAALFLCASPPLPKPSRLLPSLYALFTRWFSVKEAAGGGWQPMQECRRQSCGLIMILQSAPRLCSFIFTTAHVILFGVCMDQTQAFT